MISTQKQDQAVQFNIGDRIIYKDQEWKIAEETPDNVILYREAVDGRSRTFSMSKSDLAKFLKQQSI